MKHRTRTLENPKTPYRGTGNSKTVYGGAQLKTEKILQILKEKSKLLPLNIKKV
jgi:hypothetical protein